VLYTSDGEKNFIVLRPGGAGLLEAALNVVGDGLVGAVLPVDRLPLHLAPLPKVVTLFYPALTLWQNKFFNTSNKFFQFSLVEMVLGLEPSTLR
jgi:hypothetical protein